MDPLPAQSGAVFDLAAVAWEQRGMLVFFVFLLAVIVEQVDRDWARRVHVAAWVLFAAYLASMVQYFFFVQKSAIEGVGTLIAAPLAAAVAYHLWKGRDSLLVLSRAVAIGGLLYFPVTSLELLRRPLIETVTDHTAWLMQAIGFDPRIVSGMTVDGYTIVQKEYPYHSTFVFEGPTKPITYTIAIACTGIGSMAVFGGLIGAVPAPRGRKLRALAVSIPVIYGLNLVRNVFIGVGFGEQLFHVFPGAVMWLFGLENPVMVSYIVTDRILAQSLSVVALVGITWLVVRELPEVLLVVEDALYVATGRELDLQEALGVDAPDAADSADAPSA